MKPSKDPRRFGFLLPAGKVLLGAVLIVALLKSVSMDELRRVYSSARLEMLPVCILVGYAGTGFNAYLLKMLSSPFAQIRYSQVFAFTLIGRFLSNLLPSAIGGDIVKGVYLLPSFPHPAQAYGAILLLRIIGLFTTLAVALCAGIIWLPATMRPTFLIALVAGALAAALLAVMLRNKSMRLKKLQYWVAMGKRYPRLSRSADAIQAVMTAYYRRPGLLLRVALISTVLTLVSALSYMVYAYTLRIPLSFPAALLASSFTMLSVLVPLTPGGVGVGEGAFVLMAKLMGVPREQSIPVALLARLLTYLCSLPGGFLLIYMPRRLKSKARDSIQP